MFVLAMILQVVTMETSGWSVVGMPLQVVWSSVMVVYGALSVVIGGGHQMLELPVVS